jgi:alpha-methylacyl-CoA racemase
MPPPNLLGDYGGGSMFLVTGILAALLERQPSGTARVVDAAMVDGVTTLLQPIHELRAIGFGVTAVGLIDGATPFYRSYAYSDGRFMAVGAIERSSKHCWSPASVSSRSRCRGRTTARPGRS